MFEYFLYNIIVFFIILTVSNIIHTSIYASSLAENKDNEAAEFVSNILKPDGSGVDNIYAKIRNISLKVTQLVLGPVYKVLEVMMKNLKIITDAVQSGRQLITQVRNTAGNNSNTIMNLIYNVLADIQGKVIRVQTLIKRVFATFVAVIYATKSGFAIGESFSNSVFFKVLNFFCIGEDAIIEMKNGKQLPIKEVSCGMKTKYDGDVISIIKTKIIPQMTLYKINNTVFSGEHYIFDQKLYIWIPAKYHPDSTVITGAERQLLNDKTLYNLETTTGHIHVNNMKVKDYNDEGVLNTMMYGKNDFSFQNLSHKINHSTEELIELMNIEKSYGIKKLLFNKKSNTLYWSTLEDIEVPIFSELDKIITHNIFRT